MKMKVPPGYRSKNLEDRRGEFKRAPSTPGDRYQHGVNMQQHMDSPQLTAKDRKNIGTPRNRANRDFALGKSKK